MFHTAPAYRPDGAGPFPRKKRPLTRSLVFRLCLANLVLYPSLLGRAAYAVLEELAEIAPVQLAHVRQLLHAELPLVIVLHAVDAS